MLKSKKNNSHGRDICKAFIIWPESKTGYQGDNFKCICKDNIALGIPLTFQGLLQDVLVHHLVWESHLQCGILFHCLADRFISVVITWPAASGDLSDQKINGCKNRAFLLPQPSYTIFAQTLAPNFMTINLSTLCHFLVFLLILEVGFVIPTSFLWVLFG